LFLGSVAALVSALLGCADEEMDSGMLHEEWGGTPPPEPAEIGEACDEWVACVGGAFCDRTNEYETPECVGLGICIEVPEACDTDAVPVCGCDGALYENPCAAAMAGTGTQGASGCEPPVGTFACGFEFCALDSEYCQHQLPHGQVEAWACYPLSCTGDAEGCACITDPSPCGDTDLYAVQSCGASEGGSGIELVCLPY
jgi:hypothetical protein